MLWAGWSLVELLRERCVPCPGCGSAHCSDLGSGHGGERRAFARAEERPLICLIDDAQWVDAVVARDGKNLKGRILGFVLDRRQEPPAERVEKDHQGHRSPRRQSNDGGTPVTGPASHGTGPKATPG